ncbi:hypothetical protein ACIRJO_32175 [Streptomyces sp. NPDC102394]|uniref:hypothetical protein n=1 Tax=Streptomyces sp. NPDC102394 TaxID=3366167 RepID=UPI0037F4A04B
MPARLGAAGRREEVRPRAFSPPLLGNVTADKEGTALAPFNPQREDWHRPFLVYVMRPGAGDEGPFAAEHANEPEVETSRRVAPMAGAAATRTLHPQLGYRLRDNGSYAGSWKPQAQCRPSVKSITVQKWTSAREALEERLRKILRGM